MNDDIIETQISMKTFADDFCWSTKCFTNGKMMFDFMFATLEDAEECAALWHQSAGKMHE